MKRAKVLQDFLDDFSEKHFGCKMDGNACIFCGSEKISSEDFRDDLSRREFTISHLCQVCQDKTFTPGKSC